MQLHILQADLPPGTPGIYAGIPNEAYHAGPGISKSGLDKLARSPLHYWDAYISPKKVTRAETPAMQFGTAVHTAVLEPDTFASRYYVMPKVDGRTKDGKAAREMAQAAAFERGAIVIDEQMHASVRAVAEAVRRHPRLTDVLEAGVPELSVYWIDKDTGMLCRCRPDWLTAGVCLDIKTTEDASPAAFARSAYGWRYHTQAAFYLDGLAANGIDISYFLFAAVEKASPYACTAFCASQTMLEAGRMEYKRLLRIYAQCAGANIWPAYGDEYQLLDIPAWAQREIDMATVNAEAFET
jgi:hypothetical protein